jgi:hypothetical protein
MFINKNYELTVSRKDNITFISSKVADNVFEVSPVVGTRLAKIVGYYLFLRKGT